MSSNVRNETTLWSRAFALGPLLLLTVSCTMELDPELESGDPIASLEDGPGEAIASQEQALQTSTFRGGSVDMVLGAVANTEKALSSAAIRIIGRDAITPFGSCGATFVSPHYAVTAAHCVSKEAFLAIEEFDSRNLNPQAVLGAQSQISGTFPNWTNGRKLTSADGYNSTFLTTCSVERRCQDAPLNCPFSAARPQPDIALIHCPDRVRRNYVLPAGSVPAVGTGIEVWWFHEMYDLPSSDDGTERWKKYGYLDPSENFHYTMFHQLIPLATRARRRSDGTWVPAVIRRHDALETWGDLQICHGTSGSGVFAAGSNAYLGPAVHGAGLGKRLCHTRGDFSSTEGVSSFVRPELTNFFIGASTEIGRDRQ